MFQIDFKKLLGWLLPSMLINGILRVLSCALVMPIISLHDAFSRFMEDKLYRLSHNSQVCYLRAVLNDKFDLILRRVLVVDFEGIDRIYFWPDSDLRDVNFGDTQYFWPESAYSDSGVDFTVKIPAGVAATTSEMARLQSEINEYKLPGKNYNIVTI